MPPRSPTRGHAGRRATSSPMWAPRWGTPAGATSLGCRRAARGSPEHPCARHTLAATLAPTMSMTEIDAGYGSGSGDELERSVEVYGRAWCVAGSRGTLGRRTVGRARLAVQRVGVEGIARSKVVDVVNVRCEFIPTFYDGDRSVETLFCLYCLSLRGRLDTSAFVRLTRLGHNGAGIALMCSGSPKVHEVGVAKGRRAYGRPRCIEYARTDGLEYGQDPGKRKAAEWRQTQNRKGARAAPQIVKRQRHGDHREVNAARTGTRNSR
jgi:hypothetical protein